jgi:hypothetical protein
MENAELKGHEINPRTLIRMFRPSSGAGTTSKDHELTCPGLILARKYTQNSLGCEEL